MGGEERGLVFRSGLEALSLECGDETCNGVLVSAAQVDEASTNFHLFRRPTGIDEADLQGGLQRMTVR